MPRLEDTRRAVLNQTPTLRRVLRLRQSLGRLHRRSNLRLVLNDKARCGPLAALRRRVRRHVLSRSALCAAVVYCDCDLRLRFGGAVDAIRCGHARGGSSGAFLSEQRVELRRQIA